MSKAFRLQSNFDRRRRIWSTFAHRGLLSASIVLVGFLGGASIDAKNVPVSARPAPSATLLPYTTFALPNGLEVVVHRDRTAPVVTVQVMYRVGSLDEPEGHHGYAHLFEHLMFEGSKNYDHSFFAAMREMGASDYNGTTNRDRTVYYETVPRAALEQALFLESDRMGHLLEALTQAKLDNQVAVVLNEKHQGEDRPFGAIANTIATDLYAPGHPYHHTAIGNEKDLRAATLDDVRGWFRRYYGAANAVLFLTGDIGEEEARRLATKYFASVAPGPARERLISDSVPLTAPLRRVVEDRVGNPRLYREYVAPPMGGTDDAPVELMIQILGNGLTSRLRHRLVDELGIATGANLTFDEGTLSSEVGVIVDPVSADRVPQIRDEVDAVFRRFASEGPTQEELDRARTVRLSTLTRFIETSFGQSIILARGEQFAGKPDFYANRHIGLLRTATREDVRRIAAKVLDAGYSEIVVLPTPERSAASETLDRGKGLPPRQPADQVRFPPVTQATLSNGIKVVYAARQPAAPVEILAQFDTGAATDNATPGAPRGSRAAAVALLSRGAGARDANAIARAQEEIGGTLSAIALPDVTQVHLSLFAERLNEGAALLADTLASPRYAQSEVEQYRRERLATLEQERGILGSSGLRAVRQKLFGPDHPYGARSLRVEEAAVRTLGSDNLRRWHDRWLRPEHMTLFVAAGVPLDRLLPALDRTLGRWRPTGESTPTPPVPSAPQSASAAAGHVIIVDVPGARQAQVFAARLLSPTGGKDDTALAVANEVFGGNPSARINTDLRGAKGWSYGIGSGAADARGPRTMLIAGPVQSDRAGDTIVELQAQMRAIGGVSPPTEAELKRIADAEEGAAAAKLGATDSLVEGMAKDAIYGRSPDYAVTAAARYRNVPAATVAAEARQVFDPASMLWVVAGDAATIRPQLAKIPGLITEERRVGD